MSGLRDTGFLDPEAARRVVRRLKLRCVLLDAEKLVATLLDRLDQQRDSLGDMRTFAAALVLTGSDGECRVSCHGVHSIEGKDVREEELLQGMDLVLQFLDSLSIGLSQGLFSKGNGKPEAIRSTVAAESKKGGGK